MDRKTIFGVLIFVLLLAVPSMVLAASIGNTMNRTSDYEQHGASNEVGADAQNWMPNEVQGTPDSTSAAHRNQGGYDLDQRDGSGIRRTGGASDGYYMYDSRNPSVGKIKSGGKVIRP